MSPGMVPFSCKEQRSVEADWNNLASATQQQSIPVQYSTDLAIPKKCQKIVFIYFTMQLFSCYLGYKRCGQKEMLPLKYHLVRPCSTSSMDLLASANLYSLNSCKIFAQKNNGLAFSFLNKGNLLLDKLIMYTMFLLKSSILHQENYFLFKGNKQASNEEQEPTCQVFDCPEFESTLALQPPSAYYYYSLYAHPIPSINVSCIPGIGIFTFHFEKMNYTQAEIACLEDGGLLASTITEQKTRQLATLMMSFDEYKKNMQAYIGLNDIENEGTFISSSGEVLACSMYRAWAPGEPHSKNGDEDCVVLNSQQKWQLVKCNKKLPFICELSPNGPFQLCSNTSQNWIKTR
ncbi:uncharacterized protein LOC142319867 [Lycorma delicatula]|uniref:uncharacterized protein LOC142319867 n=1 Tax=Lycorma delicatula TaxID=130591 RepID=UPI003F51937C